MNTYYVELNFSGNVNLETGIAVSQGDYGNTQFSIATKKDGSFIADAISAEIIFNLTNGYIVTGDLEGSGGLYTYTFKGNELQSPGKTTCMVTLHFKDGRTSSEAFVFDVRYNPLYDRKIDAGPYLTELEKIKNQAQGYVDYLEILIEQLKKDVGETALTKADLQNDLLQSTPGLKALDAALGSILLTKTDAAEKFASKEDVKGFLTSDIIDNNLLGTDPTHVLASPQGKALADQITQLNSNIDQQSQTVSVGKLTGNSTSQSKSFDINLSEYRYILIYISYLGVNLAESYYLPKKLFISLNAFDLDVGGKNMGSVGTTSENGFTIQTSENCDSNWNIDVVGVK